MYINNVFCLFESSLFKINSSVTVRLFSVISFCPLVFLRVIKDDMVHPKRAS